MMRVSDDDRFVRPRTGGSRLWENSVDEQQQENGRDDQDVGRAVAAPVRRIEQAGAEAEEALLPMPGTSECQIGETFLGEWSAMSVSFALGGSRTGKIACLTFSGPAAIFALFVSGQLRAIGRRQKGLGKEGVAGKEITLP
jgi:hypothetical protein